MNKSEYQDRSRIDGRGGGVVQEVFPHQQNPKQFIKLVGQLVVLIGPLICRQFIGGGGQSHGHRQWSTDGWMRVPWNAVKNHQLPEGSGGAFGTPKNHRKTY